MKLVSYWHDTAPLFAGAAQGPVEGHYDVAVIGGGFTGLGAARQLAKAGARVVVLEGQRVGWGWLGCWRRGRRARRVGSRARILQ